MKTSIKKLLLIKTHSITSFRAGQVAAFIAIAAFVGSGIAHAQTIFVADPNGTNGVRSYNIDGTLINNSLINLGGAAPTGFQGLALVGSTLYVAQGGNNRVGKYTLNSTGGVSASSVAIFGGGGSGLNAPYGLAATATNIFVTDYNAGHVFKYSLGGGQQAVVNSVLNNPYGLAVYGDNLFVSTTTTSGANTIKRYTISTFSTTPTLTLTAADGLNFPTGLAVSGDTLYVVNNGTGSILTFNAATGASTGTLVASGLTQAQGITVYGSSLFVTGGDGTVKGFHALTGAPLAGFTTITGLSSPYGIVVMPAPCDPGALSIVLHAGLTLTGSVGCQYRIDYTTSLTAPVTWTPLTTVTLPSSPYFYMDPSPASSSRFYQAVLVP